MHSLRELSASLALTLAVLSVADLASAAWPPNGVKICDATQGQVNPTITADGAGGAMIAWQDYRYGWGASLLGNRLDSDGGLLWGSPSYGVGIAESPYWKDDPRLTATGAGTAIISYSDGKDGGVYHDIYVNCLNPSGVCLWGHDGTALCTAADHQWNPVPVSDGAGGAVVAWADLRNGSHADIYARRVNAAGVPQWTANGVGLCTAANGQWRPMIATDGSGGAVVAWHDYRTGTNLDIYARRVTSAGAAQWTSNGVPICTASGNQDSCAIVSDGSGGAIIVWRDRRSGTSLDLYAQHVSSTGSVLWTTNGVAVCTAAGDQNTPVAVADGAGGAIIAWPDRRGGVNWKLYAQRISVSGAPTWGTDGIALCPTSGDQFDPTIIPDGAGGVVIAWVDTRSGSDRDVYVQRLDGSGARQWASQAVPICVAPRDQEAPTLQGDGGGGAFLVWQDERVNGLSTDIYAQHVSGAGVVAGSISGTVRATIIDRGVDNNPSMQPLPRTRVSVLRGGQVLYSSQPSNVDGQYQITGIASLFPDDQIAIELLNDDVVIEDRNSTGAPDYCVDNPAARKILPIPTGSPADLTWPVETDGFSGEAPNTQYWNERAFADYWQGQLGLAATDRSPLHSVTRFPVSDARYKNCPSYYVTILGTKYAYCRSAIVHEFAHSILHRNAGLAESAPAGVTSHAAAGPMDEALADYFTVAWSGKTEIFPRGWVAGAPVALRNITSRRMMPACNGQFQSTGNRYNDALVLSGALWDWRGRLVDERARPSAEVDRGVLQAMVAVCALPAPDRDFLAFRQALSNTTPGRDYPDDIVWAFDRHNIKSPPDETCPHIPLVEWTQNRVDPQGRHVELVWTPTPEATAYRVYVRRWSSTMTGLGLGEMVADSLTGTTYSHLEPDTSAALAFVIVVLDSLGEEGAASQEVPQVTAVGPCESTSPSQALRAFPNPARGAIRLAFGALSESKMLIKIYDILGRQIRRESILVRGERQWLWDGRDNDGRAVDAGVYMVRAVGEGLSLHVRVVLMR